MQRDLDVREAAGQLALGHRAVQGSVENSSQDVLINSVERINESNDTGLRIGKGENGHEREFVGSARSRPAVVTRRTVNACIVGSHAPRPLLGKEIRQRPLPSTRRRGRRGYCERGGSGQQPTTLVRSSLHDDLLSFAPRVFVPFHSALACDKIMAPISRVSHAAKREPGIDAWSSPPLVSMVS